MGKHLGKFIGVIINIIMIPIVLILAIPIGILKARRSRKSRLLFTGVEQALLGKAQRTINMDENGLLSPDRDLLEVARCIESARCDYQIIKSRERFDSTFTDFVLPRINICHVIDWDNVISFFELSNYAQFEETEDVIEESVVKLKQSNTVEEIQEISGGMRLEEAEVDILAIVRNNKVIYLNSEEDHLFVRDKDGDEKLDGIVVNFVFSGRSDNNKIELFVAFNESDSHTMFALQAGVNERLDYVSNSIFEYFSENKIENVFSQEECYSTQYIYTFKVYRSDDHLFMVNSSQTNGYLINKYEIQRDNVDDLKNKFWGSDVVIPPNNVDTYLDKVREFLLNSISRFNTVKFLFNGLPNDKIVELLLEPVDLETAEFQMNAGLTVIPATLACLNRRAVLVINGKIVSLKVEYDSALALIIQVLLDAVKKDYHLLSENEKKVVGVSDMVLQNLLAKIS